jgi:putative methyltransferase (TIGR04325 family)
MKALARNVIAKIPGLRFWIARRIFLGPQQSTHRLWGVFPTLVKAKAHIPKELANEPTETKLFQDFWEGVRDDDLPVVRILGDLMPEIETIFDLGGNNGICFYQYRTKITYPPKIRWTVCDVPEVNEAGRQLAQQRGETQLAFTDHRADGSGADVYLSTGTLQYLEDTLAELLAPLKEKPKRVLINRVPMTEKSTFYSLQNTGHAVHPYYVPNHDSFVASIEALGYRLKEEWKNERACEIILRPDRFIRHFHGFYFVRK